MLRRKDLADVGDKNYQSRRNELVQCTDCWEIHGWGTQGDYYTLCMEHIFKCPDCGSQELRLVVPEIKYKAVSK